MSRPVHRQGVSCGRTHQKKSINLIAFSMACGKEPDRAFQFTKDACFIADLFQ